MINIKKILLACLPALMLAACTEDSPKTDMSNVKPEVPVAIDRTAFPQGADVSWLTQMEKEGEKFYTSDGKEMECMQLLKQECGVNSIRLRVWVNPASGWCNIDDVVVKARRANALGLRLMIDFHFSDTWCDPSNQATPAAWASYDIAQLKAAVDAHVKEMLGKLKALNIEPEWVQIGNETHNGMCYPLGNLDQGRNFTDLINSGYDAAKSVFPDVKVIVHIANGQKADEYTRIFGNLKTYGGKYDIIGISLYPEATGTYDEKNYDGTKDQQLNEFITNAVNNIKTASATYGKDVMVVEFGMDYSKSLACQYALQKLLTDGKATGHMLGVFYWEPQAPNGYNGGYSKGCFDGGKPTVALEPFKSAK